MERSPSDARLKGNEPRWFYLPRLWRQLFSIVNPRSLLAIFVTSTFIGGVIVAGFKIAVPQFVIPNNLWWMVLSLPGLILYLCLYLTLLTVYPPTINVRNRTIQRTHASAGHEITAKQVRFSRLTVHSKDRIRLKLGNSLGTLDRTCVFGVPANVDLAMLVRLLPQEPVVRDARDRSVTNAACK